MTCDHSLLGRYADDADALTGQDRARVEAHLETCASCRAALDDQRAVIGVLRGRLESTPLPGLVARVSARIDRDENAGWLGLANWRAWTVGLAPVAAGLMMLAFLGTDTTASTGTTATPSTFDEWTTSAAGSSASVFLQPAASGEALIEAVLTGTAASSGTNHER
jgi:predicted anti-sigma-YlaC factor YlaD